MKRLVQRKLLLVIFIFFLLVGISLALISYTANPQKTAVLPTVIPTTTSVSDVPYEATLEGEVICLPHKDTSGPQTLECAIGLKTDQNDYYSLDANAINQPPYTNGQRIRAKGIITPAEMLSTDQWRKYNMKGIFSLRSEVQIL